MVTGSPEKVGFCLYDYAQATNFTGTRDPQVYALDRPGDDFCRRNKPGATSLTMGVSSGWRDDYGAYLALQWVDVSSTTPGRYNLAADADPNGIIRESNESNARAFAPSMVTVPGYVAKPVGPVDASGDAPTQIALASDRYATSGDLGTPGPVTYRVVQQPARGSVSISGGTATYTPGSGAPGTDTFTYAAADAQSPYPRTATPATVTLRVGDAQAVGVSISGAPASLTAGTSAQLSATVVNAGPGVTWSADAGTVSPQGLYVAPGTPPAGGVATVRATSVDDPGASAQVQIAITPPPPRTPAPGGVGSGPVIAATPAGLPRTVTSAVARGALGAPTLTRNRRVIVVRTLARASGRLTVSAVRGRKGVATCRVKARAGRRATCLVRLPKRLAAKPVRIVVALKSADGTRASRRAMSTPRRG